MTILPFNRIIAPFRITITPFIDTILPFNKLFLPLKKLIAPYMSKNLHPACSPGRSPKRWGVSTFPLSPIEFKCRPLQSLKK